MRPSWNKVEIKLYQRCFNIVSTSHTDVVSTLSNVENPTSNFVSFSTSDQGYFNVDPQRWNNVDPTLKCWLGRKSYFATTRKEGKMERKLVNKLLIIYFTDYQNYLTKLTESCIEAMNWQFLRTEVGQIQAFQSRFPKKEMFLIIFQVLLTVHSIKQKIKRTISMSNQTTLFPLLSSNLYLSRNVYANYLFKWENFKWLYPYVSRSIFKSNHKLKYQNLVQKK